MHHDIIYIYLILILIDEEMLNIHVNLIDILFSVNQMVDQLISLPSQQYCRKRSILEGNMTT